MICFPLDNTEYTAEALGAWCAARTRGVFSGEGHFAVSCLGGMRLSVAPGIAWLKKSEWWGVAVCERSAVALTLEPCHASLHRIDAVCLRLDKNANRAELVIKKGAEAASPILDLPIRDSRYDEIYLARVNVPAGVLAITDAYVSDLRQDAVFCGLMRDGVTQVPTEAIGRQAAALISRIEEQAARLSNDTEVMLRSQYAPEASAAVNGGRLEVNSLFGRAGSSYSVEFDAPEAYSSSRGLRIDGSDMAGVFSPDGIEVPSGAWASGAPVRLDRRGNRAFFKQGGAALGLRVYSGPTMPQERTEDLIWARSFAATSAEAQKIYFGSTVPDAAAAANGDLFVLCGRGNLEIQSPDGRTGLSPLGVLQKQLGQWVPLPALLWRDGKWNLFYPVENLCNFSLWCGAKNSIDDREMNYAAGNSFNDGPAGAGRVWNPMGLTATYAYFADADYVYQARAKTMILAVYPNLNDTNQRVIMSCGSGNNYSGINGGGFRIDYKSQKPVMNFWHASGLSVDSATTMPVGQWHVVAASQHLNTHVAQLYVNGEADVSLTAGRANTPNDGRIDLANLYGNRSATAGFKGRMSYFFYYAACLDPYEIRCLSKSVRALMEGHYVV